MTGYLTQDRKIQWFYAYLGAERVHLVATDLDTFILAPNDAEVHVYDEHENLLTGIRKGDLRGFTIDPGDA